MPAYETTIIFDPLIDDSALEKEIEKITNQISTDNGTINTIQRWGLKRLAYQIKKKQQGNYVHIVFDGPPVLPKALEQNFRVNEAVLRYLTVLSEGAGVTRPELEQISTPADEPGTE